MIYSFNKVTNSKFVKFLKDNNYNFFLTKKGRYKILSLKKCPYIKYYKPLGGRLKWKTNNY